MVWSLDGFNFFPFNIIFGAIGIILSFAVIGFWIWMIIDCAKRRFRSVWEKVFWLLIIILGQAFGALIYLIIIFFMNKKGVFK